MTVGLSQIWIEFGGLLVWRGTWLVAGTLTTTQSLSKILAGIFWTIVCNAEHAPETVQLFVRKYVVSINVKSQQECNRAALCAIDNQWFYSKWGVCATEQNRLSSVPYTGQWFQSMWRHSGNSLNGIWQENNTSLDESPFWLFSGRCSKWVCGHVRVVTEGNCQTRTLLIYHMRWCPHKALPSVSSSSWNNVLHSSLYPESILRISFENLSFANFVFFALLVCIVQWLLSLSAYNRPFVGNTTKYDQCTCRLLYNHCKYMLQWIEMFWLCSRTFRIISK